MSGGIQSTVDTEVLLIDPRSGAPRVGAGRHDGTERLVERDPEPPQRTTQGATDVQAVKRQDPARIGRVPAVDTGGDLHREQAPTVARQGLPTVSGPENARSSSPGAAAPGIRECPGAPGHVPDRCRATSVPASGPNCAAIGR